MIRYTITENQLKELVEVEKAGWLSRAEDRTNTFRAARKYEEDSSIWGEIKSVYMTLQHEKCAYCERKLAGQKYGSVEHDVEHFRPKSSVKQWPTQKISDERGIKYDFDTGGASDRGYYLLAYSLLNYATACKTCNEPLKSDFFPIAGLRDTSAETAARLKAEEAFLVYPIGNRDADPETILSFFGHLPVPKYKTGKRSARGRVIIDFFELYTREELLRERALLVAEMWIGFQLLESNAPDAAKRFTQSVLDRVILPSNPHTSCCRAFKRLVENDRARAEQVADAALAYLQSQS